jgi:hypothetical protein
MVSRIITVRRSPDVFSARAYAADAGSRHFHFHTVLFLHHQQLVPSGNFRNTYEPHEFTHLYQKTTYAHPSAHALPKACGHTLYAQSFLGYLRISEGRVDASRFAFRTSLLGAFGYGLGHVTTGLGTWHTHGLSFVPCLPFLSSLDLLS